MPSYDALKNKKNELIRKALDGSAFIAPISASAIGSLTQATTLAAATLTGTADAVNIATGGNLVVSISGASGVTTALAAGDTPAQAATKITTALGSAGSASVVNNRLQIVSTATGSTKSVQVLSGTGTVLANLGLAANQIAYGTSVGINLRPLPATWDDLGTLSTDGMAFARDVSTSEVNSFGSTTPTRTDVVSDTTTLTVVAQETKLLTMGLATGADLSNIIPDANTGEVSIAKPVRPQSRYYRVLSLAVDQGDGGEIYISRFLPRAKVSSYAEQNFAQGDDPINWGVTLTGEVDSSLGYSERWLFGGAGWQALLAKMGFAV